MSVIARIHLLVSADDSILAIKAIRCNQYAKATSNNEQDHCGNDHKEEFFGFVVHFLGVLWAHSFALECLRTLFNRSFFDRFHGLLCRADHGIHVRALEQEQYCRNNVDDNYCLEGATVTHEYSPLVFNISKQSSCDRFGRERFTFLFLLIIFEDCCKGFIQLLLILIVALGNGVHLRYQE